LSQAFFLALLLNQQWRPPLRLQVSHCSTFRIMCDVPSIAVCCSESIECFPGIASRFFLELFVTIPVAPIITGIIVHLMFHVRCISIHKLLYFNFFPLPFAQNWSYLLLLLLLLSLLSSSSTFLTLQQFSWFSNQYTLTDQALLIHRSAKYFQTRPTVSVLSITDFCIRIYRTGQRLSSFKFPVICLR
jgi:hypothetical protein